MCGVTTGWADGGDVRMRWFALVDASAIRHYSGCLVHCITAIMHSICQRPAQRRRSVSLLRLSRRIQTDGPNSHASDQNHASQAQSLASRPPQQVPPGTRYWRVVS